VAPGIQLETVRGLYGEDSAHDLDHVLRVLATAEHIAAAEGADMAIVRTAALLHDVAREHQRLTGEDHAAEGARRARELLSGQPAEFVEAVCHAIESHRFRVERPPRTVEAKVLYDADKLDAIGAIGVARVFAYGGHHGRRLWAEDGEGEHTAIQEFRVKLSRIQERLITETARQIARQRHDYMLGYFEQLEAEVKGRL